MKYLRQLADLLPAVELYNLYGPTETNVCTYYKVERERLAGMDKLPIGIACENTEVFAVNDQDQIVTRPGEQGELYVRGPAVTYGYWADPGKDEEDGGAQPLPAELRREDVSHRRSGHAGRRRQLLLSGPARQP